MRSVPMIGVLVGNGLPCFIFGLARELGPGKPNFVLFLVPLGRPQSSKRATAGEEHN